MTGVEIVTDSSHTVSGDNAIPALAQIGPIRQTVITNPLESKPHERSRFVPDVAGFRWARAWKNETMVLNMQPVWKNALAERQHRHHAPVSNWSAIDFCARRCAGATYDSIKLFLRMTRQLLEQNW